MTVEDQAPTTAIDAPGVVGPRKSARSTIRVVAVKMIGILLFYVIVLVYFGATASNFFSVTNVVGILALSVPLGLAAIGQTFVIVVGGFDLSVGGVAPLCAVVYGLQLNANGPIAATVWAIAVGVGVGLINGVIVTRLHVNALITTLAMLSITGGLAFAVTNGLTQSVKNPAGAFWGSDAVLGVPWGVVGLAVVAVIAIVVLRYTSFGRRIYAVGGNKEAASLAGIRTDGVVTIVYGISGLCAALAGVFFTSQLLAISPSVGASLTLNSVAAVVLGGAALTGGVGGVGGTLVGVLLLGTIDNGLSLLQVSSYYQTIIMGAVLLLAVLFGRLRETLTRS